MLDRGSHADTLQIRYRSLGTFEFLLNPKTSEYFFLEVNPRLQVEHTITESICSTDIVKAQLRLAQGAAFEDVGLLDLGQDPLQPPKAHSIQLRLTTEDPEKSYSLSIGKIQSFRFPSGNGLRVDTALVADVPAVVSSDFDSVVGKLIVTARTWDDVVSKAGRALEDTSLQGIATNLALLRAIVSHPDFHAASCDTQWLESKHIDLLKHSRRHSAGGNDRLHGLVQMQSASQSGLAMGGASTMFKKDDAWSIALRDGSQTLQHHLQITKVLKNDFPSSFAADVQYTIQGSEPKALTMDMQSTSASGSTLNSQHPMGNRSNKDHVVLPISGKLVEVLVDVGDVVNKDEAICVVKQMKMEIEIRSHKAGIVTWVTEAEDDEDVAEGMLAAVVEDEARAKL
jgi:pyruvate carboxylase